MAGERGGTNMVAIAVVIIAGAFAVSSLVRPFVPPTRSEHLSGQRGDYMAAAQMLPVDWLPPTALAESESRRLGKPMLLVIGAAASPPAQRMDEQLLADPEIAEQIARLFIPVRIDLDEEPQWDGVFLPLQRLRVGVQPGFDMAVVDPDRGLVAWTALKPGDQPDLSRLAAFLRQARTEAQGLELKYQALNQSDWGAVQRAEGDRLRDWMGWAAGQASMRDDEGRSLGLVPLGGSLEVKPWLWNGLAASGRKDLAWDSALATLASPMADGLRGTFFTSSDRGRSQDPFPHKSAEVNAEALAVFASIAASGGKVPPSFIQKMGESFAQEFVGSQGASTTRFGSILGSKKESAYAIRLTQLWSSLPPGEQALAGRVFGLSAATPASLHPYPADLDDWLSHTPVVDRVAARLAAMQDASAMRSGQPGPTKINAAAAARLFEAGLYLDDSALRQLGARLMDPVRGSVDEAGGVDRRPDQSARQGRHLADAMGAAEALYFSWLATGNSRDLALGRRVLSRALDAFAPGGEFSSGAGDSLGLPSLQSWPLMFCDGYGTKSDAARAIEALSLFGSLAGDGERFLSAAESLADRLEPILAIQSPGLASLAAAIQRHRSRVVVESRQKWREAAINNTGCLVAVAYSGAEASTASP